MNVINSFLVEGAPPHPNDVVIKNSFYPNGLTEQDIWDHWVKNKDNILRWVNGRPIAYFLRLNDKLVMKRNLGDAPMKLTSANYENILTGRTNVLYVEQSPKTNLFVIDIDPGNGYGRKDSVALIKWIRMIIRRNLADSVKYETLSSGSKGIHVLGTLGKTYRVDELRDYLQSMLSKNLGDLGNHITVNKKGGKNSGVINLDLSSMQTRGLHICRYSLTKEGLVCEDYKKGLVKIK